MDLLCELEYGGDNGYNGKIPKLISYVPVGVLYLVRFWVI